MGDDYTEGPWIVDGLLVRAAENNEIICRIEPWSEDTDAADARLIAAAPDLLAALQLHQAWSDSENAGPDYGGMTRDTHPDGEIIWRKWWNANCDLCKRAQDATRDAISRATGADHE